MQGYCAELPETFVPSGAPHTSGSGYSGGPGWGVCFSKGVLKRRREVWGVYWGYGEPCQGFHGDHPETLASTGELPRSIKGVPIIRGTILGVPIIRIIIWGTITIKVRSVDLREAAIALV